MASKIKKKNTQSNRIIFTDVFICQTERTLFFEAMSFFDCTEFQTLLCRLEPKYYYDGYIFLIVVDTEIEEVRNNM